MNTNNNVVPFIFGESIIRSIVIKGVPWFVANDVCASLGLINSRKALSSLDEDEKGVTTSDTLGGAQKINIVNESGIYALVFKSRKPCAKAFRKWVTSEVLPAIRRTGSFHRGHQAYLYLIADQIALGVSPDLAARMAGKLTNIPKEELDGYSATPALERDIDEVTRHMQPGTSYSPVDLVELLAASHPMRLGSKASVCSSMGKLMTKAALLHRVEKLPGRNVRYRLPVIAAFPGTASN